MSMSKEDFIALARMIRYQRIAEQDKTIQQERQPFTQSQIMHLADFCQSRNPAFRRGAWLASIKKEAK